jgi:hypothetical protein
MTPSLNINFANEPSLNITLKISRQEIFVRRQETLSLPAQPTGPGPDRGRGRQAHSASRWANYPALGRRLLFSDLICY